MPDPGMPPWLQQGLGWSPAADPSIPANVPPTPDPWGGLSPSVVQGMGWAPGPTPDQAPLEAPTLPPTPQQLPSAAGHADASAAGAAHDYQVPVSAFGAAPPQPAGRAAPSPGAPVSAKPLNFDQSIAAAQQREQQTEQQKIGAVAAGVAANQGLHAEQLKEYDKADATIQANAAARKVEEDRYKGVYEKNQAQTVADRAAIDNHKFNANKFMDEMGVGDHVRWGIGQILAGVGQAMQRQSGPNAVTQMLQQKIHDANVQQQNEREALVQKLGFDKETGQDAAAFHAQRSASLDKADGLAFTALGRQLEEAALRAADPMDRARGLKEAADIRGMGDERLKGYIQLKSQHDHQQQEIGLGYGRLNEEKRHNLVQEGWQEVKFREEQELKAAALMAKKQGKLGDDESKRALFVPGPDGKPIALRNQDGTPVLIASERHADQERGAVASASAYNRIINQMVRGIADHGGESGWLKSKEWAAMQSDLESAVAELHEAYKIGNFQAPTQEFFKKMVTGGVDPTSFVRDASATLLRSRDNLNGKMNDRFAAYGYDGAPVRWQDTSSPPPTRETPEDWALQDVLKGRRDAQIKEEDVPPIENDGLSPNMRNLAATQSAQRRADTGIRQQIEVWGAMARGSDPQNQALGRSMLEQVKGKAEDEVDRDRASSLLQEVPFDREPIRGASGAPR